MVLKAPEFGSETIFQVRCQEVDVNQQLKMSSLLMLMQETSMENALKLQISIWDDTMGNTSWVLLRKEVSILKPVKLGDMIRVITYPAGFDRILAYRDFIVYDLNDELIATASSTWTLMNLDTRKIERIPAEIFKVAFDGNPLEKPASKLFLSKELIHNYTYSIKYGDLDWNGHVNNIVLTKLMIQATPIDILQKRKLENYKIHIKAECLLEESISVSIARVSASEIHYQIISLKDNRVIALATSNWQ
ncbi:MAG: medium-chain acyl-[acyl-carrier-protein] hydrolase [Saprospiraceae bacterium]|jgi:medium-chain acyl-[acyl-carrier-protein] hydrolase